MRDNIFRRAQVAIADRTDKVAAWFKKMLARLSSKQRLIIVIAAFVLFMIVDVIYIVNGFKGAEQSNIEIEHLRYIDLETIKPIEYDTENK